MLNGLSGCISWTRAKLLNLPPRAAATSASRQTASSRVSNQRSRAPRPRPRARGRLLRGSGASRGLRHPAISGAELLPMAQSSLLGAFAIDMAIQLVGFVAAWALKSEKFYDLFGSMTFLTLVWRSVLLGGGALPRHLLLTAMVSLWAVRLGTFLVVRVFKTGGDKRFDTALKQPATLFVFWTLQGIWVFVTLLPTLLTFSAQQTAAWLWTDAAGVAIWTTGFLLESVADFQKFMFKMDPKNEGRYINTGLWSVSRHPNYAGEIACWWGIYTVCASALAGPTLALAAGSPLFVMALILKLSGVPILEKNADKKWGSEAAYQDYKRRTNCVVPLPGVNFL